MRELKFRAWNKMLKFMSSSEDLISKEITYYDLFNDHEWEFQQFTGLKDSNDNEVYEGDIVRYDFEPCGEQVGVFEFKDGWFCLKGSNNWRPFKYEVIGNIYENPGLLTN